MWSRHGRRLNIGYWDRHALTRIFPVQVLPRLVDEHPLSAQFAARLWAWRHSGFQVYRAESIEPDEVPAWQRWCASIGRAVFASTPVQYHRETGAVADRTAQSTDRSRDALQWIALLTPHIPHRGEHTRHYFGDYSNAARGRRKKGSPPQRPTGNVHSAQARGHPTGGAEAVAEADADTQDFRREGRRTGARLMQRVYPVNPFIGPHCGSAMHIVVGIDDPAVMRGILEHLHLWELSPRPPPAPLLGRKREDLLPDRAPDPEPQPETGFPSDSVFRDDVPTYTD